MKTTNVTDDAGYIFNACKVDLVIVSHFDHDHHVISILGFHFHLEFGVEKMKTIDYICIWTFLSDHQNLNFDFNLGVSILIISTF